MADLEQYRSSSLEIERTADLLRILPKNRSSVLDIGARDGYFSKLLTDYFPAVTALDLRRPSFQIPRVATVAGDVTNLDFAENSFDCIFCTEVLEHIPALEKACSEIARVAKHEIVIGVPYGQDIRFERATCGKCHKVNPPWGHVNSFDKQRLVDLFPGLHVVSTSFVGTTRDVTNPVSTFLMDRAGNPWGTYADDLECIHCGATLNPPPAARSLGSKICSRTAAWINQAQGVWAKPRGNWIHILFSKS